MRAFIPKKAWQTFQTSTTVELIQILNLNERYFFAPRSKLYFNAIQIYNPEPSHYVLLRVFLRRGFFSGDMFFNVFNDVFGVGAGTEYPVNAHLGHARNILVRNNSSRND